MFRRIGLSRAPAVSVSALGISQATSTRLAAIAEASKINAKEREGLVREIQHVRRCNAEIGKLLQWGEVKALLGGNKGDAADRLSAAEIIHLTAFSPSVTIHGRNDNHMHDAGCPIAAGELSLSTMAVGDRIPAVAPCQHCLRRRLNFLASEHFAHNLHWNSILPSLNSSNHVNNQKVYQLVRASFGSMRAMEETIAEFAVNRRDAGFTWLVYNPTATNVKQGSSLDGTAKEASVGKLEVINLPGSTSPVVLGMWPVVCINLTTETIVDAIAEGEAAAASASASQVAHSWSRAARKPETAVTRQFVVSSDMTLTDLRRAAATKQTKSLDLSFMENEVQAALDYFASAEYQQATEDRKQQLTSQAQNKVVKTFENIELEAVNTLKKATATAAAAEKERVAAAAKKETTAKPAATSAASSSSSASSATTAETAAATAASAEPKAPEPAPDAIVAEGVCDDGVTRYATRGSGVTTYTYSNGTTTDVYPDGRQIAYTPDLTTTTHPDGTVHYLYANGATVEIRPDGTKYINGELSAE